MSMSIALAPRRAGRPHGSRTVIRWPALLAEAAKIVASYTTTGVTLRQLFYRLVAVGLLPNTEQKYNVLSSTTAKARRAGTFPALVDRTRGIVLDTSFSSPADASAWLSRIYKRDRTEGQKVTLVIVVEKNALVDLLSLWFGDLGIPIVPLQGYTSQPLIEDVKRYVAEHPRPAVLLIAGDHDPSGEDIDRDFVARTGCFDKVIRVALSDQQVKKYRLPLAPGKKEDSRAAAFEERHGRLVQVELDALPPDVLRGLFQDAIDRYWNDAAYKKVLAREKRERKTL